MEKGVHQKWRKKQFQKKAVFLPGRLKKKDCQNSVRRKNLRIQNLGHREEESKKILLKVMTHMRILTEKQQLRADG